MIVNLSFGNLGEYPITLPNTCEDSYARIKNYFCPLINDPSVKSRDAIAKAFLFALECCPNENPSDIWHHILYRIYLEQKIGTNPNQSWVRTSGEAFETAICLLYNQRLAEYGLRLTSLISKDSKQDALRRLGLGQEIGSSKIDVIIEKYSAGVGIDRSGCGIIGGIHAKASLAERVSDDIPTSRIMMRKGLLSVLMTLDVKSFPPPHGDLVNRGELGSPERPSDKRNYIEEHGDFSACFSYNFRSCPSPEQTLSGRKIYVVSINNRVDEFLAYLISTTQDYANPARV